MEEKTPENAEKEGAKPEEEKSAEERGLHLWRLLTSPEEIAEEEGVRLAPTPTEEKVEAPLPDVDEDILRYHREAITTINCKNHAEVPAVAECPECGSYYCRDCMTIKKGRLLCRECAETLYAPTEEELLERIAAGDDAVERYEFLPDVPPEFNPAGFGEGGEGAVSNPFKRIFAYILDLVVLRVIYLALFVVGSILLWALSHGRIPSVITIGNGNFLDGLKILVGHLVHFRPLPLLMILDFLYFATCYLIFNRTIGMSWTNLRIVTTFGDFVGATESAIRSAVLVLSFGTSIIVAFFHSRRMGLHDMLAHTYEINFSGLKRIDAYESITVKF